MYCCLCNRNILRRKHGTSGPSVGGEYIEIKMMADANGKVYVPTAGRGNGGYGNYGASFNFDVYVLQNPVVTITGNSARQSYREVASGLTPGQLYNIKIQPHDIDPVTHLPSYGWAKGFGMGGDSAGGSGLSYVNPVAQYLYEIVYDGSYMGYANSDTVIGGGFKCAEYAGCVNLRRAPAEVDISFVTSIGEYYREAQYAGCTSLIESVTESISDSLTTIGVGFREHQYYGCSSLQIAAQEHDAANMVNPGHSYREGQYRYCTSLTTTGPENPPATLQGGSEYKFNQYDGCTGIRTISRVQYLAVSGGSDYRGDQFRNCGNPNNPLTAYLYGEGVIVGDTNSLGLSDANVYRIYVPSNLVNAYKNSSAWSNITSTKFVGM